MANDDSPNASLPTLVEQAEAIFASNHVEKWKREIFLLLFSELDALKAQLSERRAMIENLETNVSERLARLKLTMGGTE